MKTRSAPTIILVMLLLVEASAREDNSSLLKFRLRDGFGVD